MLVGYATGFVGAAQEAGLGSIPPCGPGTAMPPGSYSMSPQSCLCSNWESGPRLHTCTWQIWLYWRQALPPQQQCTALGLAKVWNWNQFWDSSFLHRDLASLVFWFFKPKSPVIYKLSVIQLYMYTHTLSIHIKYFFSYLVRQASSWARSYLHTQLL